MRVGSLPGYKPLVEVKDGFVRNIDWYLIEGLADFLLGMSSAVGNAIQHKKEQIQLRRGEDRKSEDENTTAGHNKNNR